MLFPSLQYDFVNMAISRFLVLLHWYICLFSNSLISGIMNFYTALADSSVYSLGFGVRFPLPWLISQVHEEYTYAKNCLVLNLYVRA